MDDARKNSSCPICEYPSRLDIFPKDHSIRVHCWRCGTFRMGELAWGSVGTIGITSEQALNISGWIREHPDEEISFDQLKRLKGLKTPTVGEKAEKLLRYLASKYPVPGVTIFLPGVSVEDFDLKVGLKMAFAKEGKDFQDDEDIRLILELMGAGYASSRTELDFLLFQYLEGAGRFLNVTRGRVDGTEFMISPNAWAHLQSSRVNTDSQQAFVAMWFDPQTDELYNHGISNGILRARYEPFRIDRHEHNNRIDDEIIASIRRSRFVVADFTGLRGGVYFEAGFGLGLGLPVVWVCEKSLLDNQKIHFDTRQYNFITWENGKWEALALALQNRIERTLGRGTYERNQGPN